MAEVSAAVSEADVELLVVREAVEVVVARVCELNVVLRGIGTAVPVEVALAIELMVEFVNGDTEVDRGTKVDVPE